jgi:hypothetical protein
MIAVYSVVRTIHFDGAPSYPSISLEVTYALTVIGSQPSAFEGPCGRDLLVAAADQEEIANLNRKSEMDREAVPKLLGRPSKRFLGSTCSERKTGANPSAHLAATRMA